MYFELASPFDTDPGVVKLLEPANADPEQLRDALLSGTYGRPFLIEYEGLLTLYFSLSLVQSTMRLREPEVLDLAYTRKMMAFLPFYPRPKGLLLLGMGGGSLAKFCYRHLPRADITVVEIDADVIAFRDAFRLPPDSERFRIICDDAASYLPTHQRRTDIIFVDAFDGLGIAPELSCHTFYATAYKTLSDNGILVMNLAGEKAGYEDPLAQLAHAFDDRLLSLHVRDGGNQIAFAFKNPTFTPTWDRLKTAAIELSQKFGLDFVRYLDFMQKRDRRRFSLPHRSRDR